MRRMPRCRARTIVELWAWEDREDWKQRVGLMGVFLDRLTRGWYCRAVLDDPDPARQ